MPGDPTPESTKEVVKQAIKDGAVALGKQILKNKGLIGD
jgi:hypothetical protein